MCLAFFHVPVHPSHKKYLTFIWKGRMFQFQVLCFGVRNAPYTFDRLGKAVRDFMFKKAMCKESLKEKKVTVKSLQRLLGYTMAARPTVPMNKARSRGIQRLYLKTYDGSVESEKRLAVLSEWAREDNNWWLTMTLKDCQMSLKSSVRSHQSFNWQTNPVVS